MPNRHAACSSMRPSPACPHFLEHGPGDLLLRRHRIEMGPDRLGAVRVGAAQRELHALGDIQRVPACGAILADGIERAHEGAVGIALARPDMALVDMGVAVDEGRQHDAAGKVDGAGRQRPALPRGNGCYLAVGDRDVGQREAVGVESSRQDPASASGARGHWRARTGRCLECGRMSYPALHRGICLCKQASTAPASARFRASACRIKCEISVSTRKIRMPVTEIRISAANSRGALRR